MSDQDLLRYYKVLKQFLDISDDTTSARSKSNSSRAQRAREKLLKLSSAQFKELSTDVYDELKRRIDESRTEPDFLLPKLTFHPKRNQARQKLSSLPQSRFKDLVSDISFEIERRNLHNSTHSTSSESNNTNPTHQQRPSQDQSISDKVDHQHGPSSELGTSSNSQYDGPGPAQPSSQASNHSRQPTVTEEPLPRDLATPKMDAQVQQQTIGIQPTTVVPTKANLAWSSDEEDEEEQPQRKNRGPDNESMADNYEDQHGEEVIRRISLSNGFAPRFDSLDSSSKNHYPEKQLNTMEVKAPPLEDLKPKLTALEERNRQLESDLVNLREEHSQLLGRHESITAANETLEALLSEAHERQRNQPNTDEYAQVLDELESLKKVNAAIRLENQALKNSQTRSTKPTVTESQNSPKSTREISADLNREAHSQRNLIDVNSQLERLYLKMDCPPSKADQKSAALQLQSENARWQKIYEDSQQGKISLAIKSPFNSSEDIKSYLSPSGAIPLKTASKLFAYIDSFVLALNGETIDNDFLFEKMSKIALLANNIASRSRQSVFNSDVHSGFVREAAGHALTTTRYFALYRQLLPKVVVERAVAEVAFSVCDYIAEFKLTDAPDVDARKIEANREVSHKKMEEPSKMSKMTVRPLKIASKLQSNLSFEILSTPLASKSNTLESQTIPAEPRPAEIEVAQPQSDSIKELKPVKQHESNFSSFKLADVPKKKKILGSDEKVEQPTKNYVFDLNQEVDDSSEKPLFHSSKKDVTYENEILDRTSELSTNKVFGRKGLKDSLEEPNSNSNFVDETAIKNSPTVYREEFNSRGDMVTADSNIKAETTPVLSIDNINKEAKLETDKPLRERLQSSQSIGQVTDSHKPEAKELTGSGLFTAGAKNNEIRKSPETPKKSSILDKVRKFESPQENKVSSPVTPTAPVAKSANSTFSDLRKTMERGAQDVTDEEKSPIASSSPKLGGSVPTRGKSIFQSLREKFANERTAKQEESDTADKSTLSVGNTAGEEEEKTANSSFNSIVRDKPSRHEDRNDDFSKNVKHSGFERVNEVQSLSSVETPTTDVNRARNNSTFDSQATLTTQIEKDGQEAPLSWSAKEMPGAFESNTKPQEESPCTISSTDRDSIYEEANEEETSSKTADSSLPDTTYVERSDDETQDHSKNTSQGFMGIPVKASSLKVKKVNYAEVEPSKEVEDSEYDDNDNGEDEEEEDEDEDEEEEEEARQRQEYRKSMAAATFNFDLFDIDDPDNTLTQVLLYLEHQTVQVITTIQDLLSAIKRPDSTRGELRENSMAISEVIRQMTEATNTSMNQTRNFQLKEHGSWVVKSLEDCNHRMNTLCRANTDKNDLDFADKNFKQRLAGISFDIAKCTKELVKTVEEASLKEDIAHLDARLNHQDDLT